MTIRNRFPIFKNKIYMNSCSQGALSLDVQDAYASYLRDWDDRGSPWEYWVERIFFEEPRANFSFALMVSILLLIVTLVSALNRQTKNFFTKSEEHEQPNKHTESAGA